MALDNTGDIPTTCLSPAASTKQPLWISSKSVGMQWGVLLLLWKKDILSLWFCGCESREASPKFGLKSLNTLIKMKIEAKKE